MVSFAPPPPILWAKLRLWLDMKEQRDVNGWLPKPGIYDVGGITVRRQK
jgi:hypothetical protein